MNLSTAFGDPSENEAALGKMETTATMTSMKITMDTRGAAQLPTCRRKRVLRRGIFEDKGFK
jgi:hypothetical protein